MNEKCIDVNERAYEWSSATRAPAPWPKRNKLKVNVQDIPHDERPKDYCIYIDSAKNIGYVEWLTQDSSYPSDELISSKTKDLGYENYVKDANKHN